MTDPELTEIVGAWVFWPLIVGPVSDPLLDRHGWRRLAVLRHAEDMAGKVAITGACRHRLALLTRNGESLHRLGGVHPAPAGSDEQGPGLVGSQPR
jgi:hypothetical protein